MKVLAIILAGGKGTRLYPLTEDRCKPAVPFGGKYRIIDFAIANCINSGIRQINVMVQYLSDSLQKHIRDGWSILSPALNEYIDVYPPQQRYSEKWYQGTADAIFQNLFSIKKINPDYILVLAGDHIYKMDYREMIRYHIRKSADLTIATTPTPINEASEFGIMEVDSHNRIIGFEEKPEHPKHLPNNPTMALASMGIYVFSKDILFHHLVLDADSSSSHDFGKDIIPKMVDNNSVFSFAHQYNDGTPRYWRDVGTLKAYYDANMDLLKKDSPFDLYSEDWKFRTCQSQSAPTMISFNSKSNSYFMNNIVTGGAIIKGSAKNSILSPGVIIEENAVVENSILFNHCHIKKGAVIKNAIIEKNVVIPEGFTFEHNFDLNKTSCTQTLEGLIIVPKHALIS